MGERKIAKWRWTISMSFFYLQAAVLHQKLNPPHTLGSLLLALGSWLLAFGSWLLALASFFYNDIHHLLKN